jgi:hypothetical protein
MNTLSKRILWELYRLFRKVRISSVTENVFRRSNTPHYKRALFCYLAEAFSSNPKLDPRFDAHSNWRQNLLLGELLDRKGYIVDVVDFRSGMFRIDHHYDILLGMGPAVRFAKGRLPPRCISLYIATSMHGAVSAVHSRLEALNRRRRCQIPSPDVSDVNESVLNGFHGIACFGNAHTASTFAFCNRNVLSFNNSPVPGLITPRRDYAIARRHFLYLATFGQVRKGLDLLLDIFSRTPSLHLYICAPVAKEKPFFHCYQYELTACHNIHLVGWVSLQSRKFQSVSDRCGALLLPSCAEGQAGAVIDGMHLGLTPIVSEACGVDTKDFGITMPNCELHTIESVLARFSEEPPERHEERSAKTLVESRANYTEGSFQSRLSDILECIEGFVP